MSKFFKRKRLKFLDDHTYLSRNMVVDSHTQEFYDKFLSTLNLKDMSQYPDLWKTYDKLSNFLSLDHDNILITRGVEGAIKQVFDNLKFKRNAIGIISPTYAMYEVYARSKNIDVKKISGEKPEYKISIEKVKALASEVDVIFLDNPKSHIPHYFEKNEIDEILQFCQNNGTILFLDEVYVGWESDTYLNHSQVANNLIVASGLSKIGFPSFKAGWLVTNKNLKKILESNRSSYELNYFACKGIEFIIDNIDYVEDLKDNLLNTKKRWISKLKNSNKFKIYDSKNYVIRAYSEDSRIAKTAFEELKSEKIIVGLVDECNLVFSVTNCHDIENKIIKALK